MSNKYEAGFSFTPDQEKIIEERAKKQAEFYIAKLAEMEDMPLTEDEVRLIHFFGDKEVIKKQKLENRSPLYDCGREWLKEVGLDIEQMDQKFDNQLSYLVAIPTDSLNEWTDTKSWLKLSQAGSLDHAAVVTLPRDKIIFREHAFVERSFVDGDENGELAKKYYESTTDEGGEFKMTEAWVPQGIEITGDQILQFEN